MYFHARIPLSNLTLHLLQNPLQGKKTKKKNPKNTKKKSRRTFLPFIASSYGRENEKLEKEGESRGRGFCWGEGLALRVGVIREKPESEAEAREFIAGYGVSPAKTVGAIAVTDLGTGRRVASGEATHRLHATTPYKL